MFANLFFCLLQSICDTWWTASGPTARDCDKERILSLKVIREGKNHTSISIPHILLQTRHLPTCGSRCSVVWSLLPEWLPFLLGLLRPKNITLTYSSHGKYSYSRILVCQSQLEQDMMVEAGWWGTPYYQAQSPLNLSLDEQCKVHFCHSTKA